MNDYIWIFNVAAYICVGVFVVVWMDNEYFDLKGDNKSVAGWWWKMAIWPVLVLFVYPKICDGAFDECDSLGEIHLPASLRKLGAILGDQPIDVYCHFADPTQCEVSYDKDEPESWSNNMDNWLYVPQGSRALYEKTEPWCYFETIKEF